MFLFGGTIGWRGFGEGSLNGLEQVALVCFDLQEVFAATLDDGPGGLVLAVERVGGNGFPVEFGKLREQVLRGF